MTKLKVQDTDYKAGYDVGHRDGYNTAAADYEGELDELEDLLEQVEHELHVDHTELGLYRFIAVLSFVGCLAIATYIIATWHLY